MPILLLRQAIVEPCIRIASAVASFYVHKNSSSSLNCSQAGCLRCARVRCYRSIVHVFLMCSSSVTLDASSRVTSPVANPAAESARSTP